LTDRDSGSIPDKTATIAKDGVIGAVRCTIGPVKDCGAVDGYERVPVDFGTPRRPTEICLPGHNFPGRTAFLRVDKNSETD
jgi:hypothetical protein